MRRTASSCRCVCNHGPWCRPSLFERQSGLGSVECLNLAFLVERQHNGVRGRIDIEPDNIVQFVGELGIVRQLELSETVGLQAMRLPNAAHRVALIPLAEAIMSAVQCVVCKRCSQATLVQGMRSPTLFAG